MKDLKLIPGVGENLASKLREGLGGDDLALKAIEDKDVASISSINGISLTKAVKIVNDFAGGAESAIKTKDAQKIHDLLLQDIAPFISSSPARRKLGIMQPLASDCIDEINARRQQVSEATDFVVKNRSAVEEWAKIFSKVRSIKRPHGKEDRLVVVSCSEDVNRLAGLGKYARVVVRGEGETWKDYLGLHRVTWIGPNPPPEDIPGWKVCVLSDDNMKMVPELALSWFEDNEETLQKIERLKKIEFGLHGFGERISVVLEKLSPLSDLLEAEDDAADLIEVSDSLWREVKNIEGSVNDMIVSATSEATLSIDGGEMLTYYTDTTRLQDRLRYEVDDSIQKALQTGLERLNNYLGLSGIEIPNNCFETEYPCVFDRTIVSKIEEELDGMITVKKSTQLMLKADLARSLMEAVDYAVSELIDIDLWIGIAKWSQMRRCSLPKIEFGGGPGCYFEGFRHPLLGVDPVPVDYGFGGIGEPCPQGSVVLLTGANSGGKTSLIEGVSMVISLAHAGLPVPADLARVSLAQEIHVMSKVTGTQSAGALERTLVRLAKVFGSKDTKFVLADELEAITEPDAASGILAGLLDVAANEPSTSVLMVTHIGSSICEKMQENARVDGIEARGLDEQMELIVDRVPKIGVPAKSTPELILKRLQARSQGSESEIFRSILSRL
tara:strand:- start:28396 stop:30405 length:2010 start_codon:yes stop_codon:yes gene_type:complete